VAAEYPIYAKVDASGVTQGTQKVKQDLRQVAQEASTTGAAIDKAFDPSGFERSIGTLISRIDTLDKTLLGVSQGSTAVVASNKALTGSLDQVAASGGRAGKAVADTGTQAGNAAKGQAALDAALRRVLQATDAEAAGQQRLNVLLADAKRLLDAGVITQERYAQVQRLSQQASNTNTVSIGQQRAGYTQLGFQIQDITQTLALGINPLVVLAQQGGQTASALSLALGTAGTAGKVATYMAGPFGSLILAAVSVLGNLAYSAYKAGNETDNMADKLKKDAHEADVARKAHQAFTNTIEGQIDAQRRLNDEIDRSILTQRQQAQLTLANARQSVSSQQNSRAGLVRQIGAAQTRSDALRNQVLNPGVGSDPEAILGIVAAAAAAEKEVSGLKARLADLDTSIANGQRAVREAQQPLIQSDVEASLDKKASATLRYTEALGKLNRQLAIGAGKQDFALLDPKTGNKSGQILNGIGEAEYRRELLRITTLRDARIKAAADEKKAANASDGVSRFRTRAQAIGIAGRELQGQGLRVSENEQFGGITPGAHKSGHQNAIDVNSGTGITEANVPDLRSKFEALARRYQARGYRVLWNGNVYEAGGSGPTGPIRGSDQHRDHLHVEAPTTIVGKATNASGEAQANREEKTEATKAEQQSDFVSGIITEAGSRGTGNQAEALAARIGKVQEDYKRRFNESISPEDLKKVTGALTDAEARETAERFDQAYVQPLARLQAAQGKTGLEREVLNRQLAESDRLGRALTPTEAGIIANTVKQGDALNRQQAILEGVRQPLEDYRAQLLALNTLLATGAINQTQFNSRVADLGSGARSVVSSMPGVDSKSGQAYGDIGARAEEDARYANEQDKLQANREQLLAMGIDYDALEEAARRRHIENLRKIDQARKDQQLGSAQDVAGSLLQITEATIGKNNALYKTLFVTEKAIAIARSILAIQTGIAQAAANPFPYNLAAIASVAAATASIVSNIQSVALNLADGGMVRGPGGPRSDSVPANLSNGEFVVNARATASNRALLEAINSGSTMRQARLASNDNRGGGAGQRPLNVSIDSSDVPGIAWEQNQRSDDDMAFIARRVVQQEAEPVVARAMGNANSRMSRAVTRNTLAGRRRS
jgi:hypothetical protein